jgi:hypothetical protein
MAHSPAHQRQLATSVGDIYVRGDGAALSLLARRFLEAARPRDLPSLGLLSAANLHAASNQ